MERLVIRLTSPKKTEIFRETLNEPGPHDIILKTTISGICRSDMPTYLGEASMV